MSRFERRCSPTLNVCLCIIILAATLISGQISPGSQINSSTPCIAPRTENKSISWITLFTPGDVKAISGCVFFHGSIFVDSSFQGDIFLPKLDAVDGQIVARNTSASTTLPGLTGLIFPNLTTLVSANASISEGGLIVYFHTQLKTIWLPKLSNYTGEITLNGLPALSNLSTFEFNVGSPASNSRLQVINTNITTLKVSNNPTQNPGGTTFESIAILGNRNLVNLSLMTESVRDIRIMNVTGVRFEGTENVPISVTGSLAVEGCPGYLPTGLKYVGGNYSVLDSNTTWEGPWRLPTLGNFEMSNNPHLSRLSLIPSSESTSSTNLKTGGPFNMSGSIKISDYPNTRQIEVLQMGSIGDSFMAFDCPSLTTISLPDTRTIGGSFVTTGLPFINNISVPVLESIGGNLNITYNYDPLNNVIEFPSLQTVSGAVLIEGNIIDIRLPLLEHAFKGFIINTTNPAFKCTLFDQLYSSQFIRAPYYCTGSKLSTISEPSSRSKPALSTGVKAGIGIGASIVCLTLIAVIIYFWRNRGTKEDKLLEERDQIPELPQGGYYEKVELPAASIPGELAGSSVGDPLLLVVAQRPIPHGDQSNGEGLDFGARGGCSRWG